MEPTTKVFVFSEQFQILQPKELINEDVLVRIGDNWDGGYIVPNSALQYVDQIVSYGLGNNFSFEKDFRDKKIVNVKVYDHSVDYRSMIREILHTFAYICKLRNTRFHCAQLKVKIGFIKSYRQFFSNDQTSHLKNRIVGEVRLEGDLSVLNTVKDLKFDRNLLKMDIEGFEYEVLPHLIEHLPKFFCMCIEFHDVSRNSAQFLEMVSAIGSTHSIVHTHTNNAGRFEEGVADILELTFLKNSHTSQNYATHKLPIKGLDYANSPSQHDPEIHFRESDSKNF